MKFISILQRFKRAAKLPFFVFVLLIMVFTITAKSQTLIPRDSIPTVDSLKTVRAKDTLLVKDTIQIFTPHFKHGLFSYFPSHNQKITKFDIQWINYSAGSDVLMEASPVVPQHLGNYGLWNTNSFMGSGISDLSVRWNGRSLGGIINSSVPFDVIPLEFVESIEVLTGVDAIAFSDNSSGAVLNAQEIRYNTAKPYTRLWYSQGGNNYIATDGIYSQNFAPNLNLTLGFRRMSSEGRFTSSGIDAWNVRTKLQYTPSDKSILSFTYMFTNHDMGAFGGLSSANTDNITSEPWYVGANTVMKRNDATITFSTFISDDTTSNLTALLYYSNALTEQKNLPFFDGFEVSNLTYKQQEAILGTSIRFEQYLIPKGSAFSNSIRTGGEAEVLSTNETVYYSAFSGTKLSGYGIFHQNLGSMYLKASVRGTLLNDQFTPSLGLGVFLPFAEKNIIKLEAIQSTNLRTIFEPIDQSVVNSVVSLQSSIRSDSLLIEPFAFIRNVDAKYEAWSVTDQSELPIGFEYKTGTSRTLAGFGFTVKNSVWRFFYSVNAQYTYQGMNDNTTKLLPDLYGSAEVYYQHLAGSSIGRLGVRIRGNTAVNGFTFSPILNSFTRFDTADFPTGFNGIDLFATAKLGDAYIRLTYMNVLNQTYGYVPIYPQLDGNFRISVGWAFFE